MPLKKPPFFLFLFLPAFLVGVYLGHSDDSQPVPPEKLARMDVNVIRCLRVMGDDVITRGNVSECERIVLGSRQRHSLVVTDIGADTANGSPDEESDHAD